MSRRCSAASAAMSASRFSQGMSGWRRMVPVEEQGASSRTASNGPARHCVTSAATISAVRSRRARLLRSRSSRAGARSTATTWAPAAASCAVLPPGAAQRSATVSPRTSPNSRAGSAAAASCTHQAPSAIARQLRRPARARCARTEPVGSTRPPSTSAQCSGSFFTVRSSAGSRPLAAAMARAVSAP